MADILRKVKGIPEEIIHEGNLLLKRAFHAVSNRSILEEKSLENPDPPAIDAIILSELALRNPIILKVLFYCRNYMDNIVHFRNETVRKDFYNMFEPLTILNEEDFEQFADRQSVISFTIPGVEDDIVSTVTNGYIEKDVRLNTQLINDGLSPWAVQYFKCYVSFLISQISHISSLDEDEQNTEKQLKTKEQMTGNNLEKLIEEEILKTRKVENELNRRVRANTLILQVTDPKINLMAIDIPYNITIPDIISLINDAAKDYVQLKKENYLLEFFLRAASPTVVSELDRMDIDAAVPLMDLLISTGVLSANAEICEFFTRDLEDEEVSSKSKTMKNIAEKSRAIKKEDFLGILDLTCKYVRQCRECLYNYYIRKFKKLRDILDTITEERDHLDAMKRDFKLSVLRNVAKRQGPRAMYSYLLKWENNIHSQINIQHCIISTIQTKLNKIEPMDVYLENLGKDLIHMDHDQLILQLHIAEHKNTMLDEKLNKLEKITVKYLLDYIYVVQSLDRTLFEYNKLKTEYNDIKKKYSREVVKRQREIKRLITAEKWLSTSKIIYNFFNAEDMVIYTRDSTKKTYQCKKERETRKCSILQSVVKKIDDLDYRIEMLNYLMKPSQVTV